MSSFTEKNKKILGYAILILVIIVGVYFITTSQTTLIQTGTGAIPEVKLTHVSSHDEANTWSVSFGITTSDTNNDTYRLEIQMRTEPSIMLLSVNNDNVNASTWVTVWREGETDPAIVSESLMMDLSYKNVVILYYLSADVDFDARLMAWDVGGNWVKDVISSRVDPDRRESFKESASGFELPVLFVGLMVANIIIKRKQQELN